MKIEPTSQVNGNLFDLLGDEYASEAFLSADSDTPYPWDADISFDGESGLVRMEGGIAPGGVGDGVCVITISFDTFSDYYQLDIPDEAAEIAEKAGFLVGR